MDDDLGHHAVIERRDELAFAHGGDHLHAFLFREAAGRHLARVRAGSSGVPSAFACTRSAFTRASIE